MMINEQNANRKQGTYTNNNFNMFTTLHIFTLIFTHHKFQKNN